MALIPSHLPDLCLLNIFKRVPLVDLIRWVRLVCTNWDRVVSSELRCRRSVVLFRNSQEDVQTIRENENSFRSDLMQYVRRDDGSPWVRPLERICFNSLLVPGGVLSQSFASSLMDTLPVISHLTVVQNNVPSFTVISSLKQIIRLIIHYASSLVSLKIDFFYLAELTMLVGANSFHNDLSTNSAALLNSINQLESLRHLTLNVNFADLTSPHGLAILSRLSIFTSKYIGTSSMASFRQYATGNVRIHCEMNLSLEDIIGMEPWLATKFASVSVIAALNHDNMRLFSARFSNLTRLSLFNNPYPMTMLARYLSPLARLVYLKVAFVAIPLQDEEPQPNALTQVPSVRLLSLFMNSTSHLDNERLHLSELFANVQVLELNDNVLRCAQCGLVIGQRLRATPERRRRIEQCLRLSRVPFRRCHNLRIIRLQGTAQYFLPNELITPEQF